MSDLHSINEAINARAGRKLLPSIAVGLSLVALIWLSLAFERTAFAFLLSLALVLATKELSAALTSVGFVNSFRTLAVAVVTISLSTWFAGINGLVIATATSFTAIVLFSLRHGTDNFVKRASSTALALTYLPLLGGFIMLIARPSNGLAAVMTFLLNAEVGKPTYGDKFVPCSEWSKEEIMRLLNEYEALESNKNREV